MLRGGFRRLSFAAGHLPLRLLLHPEEELQTVHIVEGVDPRLVLVRCLCLLLLAGNQAQGEQVEIVGGVQAAKVLLKLINGKHLLCRRILQKMSGFIVS